MRYISISAILTIIAACYVVHTIWTLASVFIPPTCRRGERCYTSYLSTNPDLNLVIFTSVNNLPSHNDPPSTAAKKIHTTMNFDYRKLATFPLTLEVPRRTRLNGTMYMHVGLLNNKDIYKAFDEIRNSGSLHTLPMVIHMEPQAATFNLLNKDNEKQDHHSKNTQSTARPYSHILTEIPLSILTDDLALPDKQIPGELYPYIRIRNGKFMPILQYNILKTRLTQYQLLTSNSTAINVTVNVAPISYGALRLTVNMKQAMEQMHSLGFSHKDLDDIKGIFADANLYLLSATVFFISCHVLFDFLAFKNDVSFWRSARSLSGLSARTVIWRAVSQTIIFLYLMDEKTSLLVLIPAAISLVIEVWKVKKILHMRIERTGLRFRVVFDSADVGEKTTAAADAEAMRYLSMLLYPLCVAGAIYSLVYEPHKSWYSWAIQSTVKGVYAFGFLFMLPQLFVNYRLRSVAALPWRAFMYKAFNTFIDDVFAFMITMPTAHRVACFRDDLVFIVYLYQRWLYPVDKTRTDTGAGMDETPDLVPVDKKTD